MTTESQLRTLAPQSFDLSGRVVVLATDGSAAARAATRVAGLLASERGAVVHVVSVVDSSSAPIPPPLDVLIALSDTQTGPRVHEEQVRDVREMIADATGESCTWEVHVVLGSPAAAIVATAKRLGAALIVLGLRHHGRLDRILRDETVLNVVQSTPCSVLGVSEQLTGLPERVLAAVDFAEASEGAARAAQSIIRAGGAVTLAYSAPVTGYVDGDSEFIIRELGIQAGFERLANAMRDDSAVDHLVLHHQAPRPAADVLLDYADEMRADLIAAGSAKRSRMDRWLLGSVSTELVRAGTKSVLIIPAASS